MKYKSDGCITKARVRDGSVTISAESGYNKDVDILCQVEDNGNGYYVRIPSYTCVQPDHIFNLDYAEIEYIYYAYKALKKAEQKGNNHV